MKLLNITPESLASYTNCKTREARRYLNRRHAGALSGGFYRLTPEQSGAAVDALRRVGRAYAGRAAYSATNSQLANSNAPLISKREK
jgi:hypothetical protein